MFSLTEASLISYEVYIITLFWMPVTLILVLMVD